jgi:hypothetical protein
LNSKSSNSYAIVKGKYSALLRYSINDYGVRILSSNVRTLNTSTHNLKAVAKGGTSNLLRLCRSSLKYASRSM